MNLKRILFLFVELAALVSLGVSPVRGAVTPPPAMDESRGGQLPLADIPAGWLRFQNTTWQYSIGYPSNWTAGGVLSNSANLPLDIIRQRDVLNGLSGASVSVDVWQKAPATDLMSWFNAHQRQMLDFAAVPIPGAPNAVVSGQPALIVGQAESGMSPGALMVYIDAADRVLVVQYIAGDGGSALSVFQTMLDSILILPLSAPLADQPKSIPTLQMPPSEAGHKGGTCVLAPNGEGCCGHPQISHWRCAADSVTGDHKSNCVYWAALMRPDVGKAVGSGNANQWAIKAKAAGLSVDTTPRIGDIMVAESLSVYGHVAYVISVSATTITVTEMNWCSRCPERTHVYAISGKKFIHGAPVEGPNLIAPAGQMSDNQPAYSWTSVEDTEKYVLQVHASSGALMYENEYLPNNICTSGVCTVTPPLLLINDTYVWKVQAQRSDSTAPWSAAKAFSVGRPTALEAPTGTVHLAQPTFTWQNVPGAARYNLQINLPDQIVFEEEYIAAEVCEGNRCTVLPQSLELASGTYTWRVETLDENGIGPWSEDLSFQILVSSGEGAVLRGKLALPGRPQPPDPRWVTTVSLQFFSVGGPATGTSLSATTDPQGQFVVQDLAAGTYRLLVKPAGALQKDYETVTLQSGENPMDFDTFQFGDANGDNYVNATDFSLLSAAYGACQSSPKYNLAANFNGDECVTAADFSLLSASYGSMGDS